MSLYELMSKDSLDVLNDTCVPLLLGVLSPDPTRCQVKRPTLSMGTTREDTAMHTSQLKSKFQMDLVWLLLVDIASDSHQHTAVRKSL